MKTPFKHLEIILLSLPNLGTLFLRQLALLIISIPRPWTTRQSTSLALKRIIYNWRLIGKIIRCFLPTGNISKIELFVADIEVHLCCLAAYIGQEHFKVLKNTLYLKNLVVSQVIRLNKSIKTGKENFVIIIPSIRHDQVMTKIYNAKARSK